MTFTCLIGDNAWLEFQRSNVWGSVSASVNGRRVFSVSPFNLTTLLGTSAVRRYRFTITEPERIEVVVEKHRPLVLAGFRNNEYRVFANGKQVGVFVG